MPHQKRATEKPRLRPLRRFSENGEERLEILDQTCLPYRKYWQRLESLKEVIFAIQHMQVRGAPLIGVVAAYGLALGLGANASDRSMNAAVAALGATRPTAVNLAWALDRMGRRLYPLPVAERAAAAWREADAIAEEDALQNRAIGEHGLKLLQAILAAKPKSGRDNTLQLMTHCNAGWLATVEHGTALSPVYVGREAGLRAHVWVSETRPRNQGLLTAWELFEAGIPHTLIADNAAGLLLLQGRVDAVIVGADRIAANGDVANKVGTSLKALAARYCGIPFYVAAPGSTLDFAAATGRDIPLEIRDDDEMRFVYGQDKSGERGKLQQINDASAIYNPAFDVTPAECITAIITERGVCAPNAAALAALFPQKAGGDHA
ncbi:MAG: S-methyl-5-thioribose-1-phosphate isomerase [Zoogloeaceae bacterium]|jgi:methylthioribose-1-phosphate isomerase|nr:S-methyl-5-thioribose-1-phosphate isomerase [Zoogloeaceae bacterium]